MRVYLAAFAAHDVVDDEPSYERVDELCPFNVRDDELEGYMYELASITEHDGDWITVVAYEPEGAPIKGIDFGRRYTRSTYASNEFGRVWDPSRDYWHNEELDGFVGR